MASASVEAVGAARGMPEQMRGNKKGKTVLQQERLRTILPS
jgi:hypothetical protein